MHPAYDDITSRIGEAPIWWLRGVPRYKQFEPHDADIYASEAILLNVACQSCGQTFLVCQDDSRAPGSIVVDEEIAFEALAGDPPHHFDHSPTSPTIGKTDRNSCHGVVMGFEWLEIVEVWQRERVEVIQRGEPSILRGDWHRRTDLELKPDLR
jgi:hypothetical protein